MIVKMLDYKKKIPGKEEGKRDASDNYVVDISLRNYEKEREDAIKRIRKEAEKLKW